MKGTILIVEDDPDISESLEVALSFEGYETRRAPNGLEGIRVLEGLEASGRVPLLILLDITMPVLDGAGFLTAQKANPRISGVPVILMSAARDRVRQGILLQVAAHLHKPMGLVELNELVERVAATGGGGVHEVGEKLA